MLLLNKQMTTNYRKEWFNWVAKTRKRLSTKKKPCSHKEAMAKASITWPKEKAKLERRARRAAKQEAKVKAKTVEPSSPPETHTADE